MLEFMLNGCGGCKNGGNCAGKEHHEPLRIRLH
jgi:hypothetical protein